MQHKSDFIENNGSSLTNPGTRQGLMDQIAMLKGEIKEKNRQISALLNIISSKNPTEIHHVLYKVPRKPEKRSKPVAEFANCTPPACHDFDAPKKNFLQATNINGEVSQHNKSNSVVQLQNNLSMMISQKVRNQICKHD